MPSSPLVCVFSIVGRVCVFYFTLFYSVGMSITLYSILGTCVMETDTGREREMLLVASSFFPVDFDAVTSSLSLILEIISSRSAVMTHSWPHWRHLVKLVFNCALCLRS